jgi:K+-transporting ATPase ATPase A chain
MWFLPISILVVSVAVSYPLGKYLAWIMDGRYHAPRPLKWCEDRVNSGPQNWKQYAVSLLVFNIVLYVFGYIVLVLQPFAPLNPRGLGALAPSTIFNTVISFSTNTDIQHYSGDQSFSNFTQIFFCLPMFFLSAAIGFCALTAIIRAFRSDEHVGNFFLDMWRVVFYTFLPAVFVLSMVFLVQGMPMTYQSDYQVNTLEAAAMGTDSNNQPKQQTIVIGPLAAFVPMKML